MIVLGVIRIRAAHQRTQVVNVDERAEMEWDNSALTITVNPMDTEAGSTQPCYGDNFTQVTCLCYMLPEVDVMRL